MKDDLKWERLELNSLKTLLNSVLVPWWVAGGLAIDLFLKRETRTHDDLDIVINRADQLKFISALKDWDLRATDPPGSLLPLKGEEASPNANAIWCREDETAPWRFEILLAPFSQSEWIYRRVSDIRGPIDSFGWQTSENIRVISPEIQLLYKSKARRQKDEVDFQNCLPLLSSKQKNWLKTSIQIEHGTEHPWLALL
jgi:hypothetical protein